MNVKRRQKLAGILFILAILAAVLLLVLYALRQNISLFYTPTEAAQKHVPLNQLVRLGGMVVKGSIKRSSTDLDTQFALTDYKSTVIVHYQGILPDLFREGQGIVTKGKLNANKEFQATEVLAKHDANYMPAEVKAALAQAKEIQEKKKS